jgi:hypothetical protein
MIDSAVELAEYKYGHTVENFDFLIVGRPDESHNHDAIAIHLDDDAFTRKISAALAYTPKLAQDVEAALGGAPFQGLRRFSQPQLAGEVDVEVSASLLGALTPHPKLKSRFEDMIEGVPLEAFRIECLRPARSDHWPRSEPLFYELYGKIQTGANGERLPHHRRCTNRASGYGKYVGTQRIRRGHQQVVSNC